MSKFYEGRKIEVQSKCKNDSCGKDVVWYKIFPQKMSSSLVANVISCDENVSSARVNIVEEREDEIDVNISYRCRFCDELHEQNGTIKKENNELVFNK